jgi:hypothetical protein
MAATNKSPATVVAANTLKLNIHTVSIPSNPFLLLLLQNAMEVASLLGVESGEALRYQMNIEPKLIITCREYL